MTLGAWADGPLAYLGILVAAAMEGEMTFVAEALSRRFDQLCFAILSLGYVALNLALPLASSSAG